jgi:mRNA-degrading endonuclease YafQ of YafQ-DinJ toxin-antitoxin module
MPMRGKRVSPLRKEVYKLDFRVDFKKCMKRADTDSTKLNTILSDMMQTEGGEA